MTHDGEPEGNVPRPGIDGTGVITIFAGLVRMVSRLEAGIASMDGGASRDLLRRVLIGLSSMITDFMTGFGLTVGVGPESSTISTCPSSCSSGDSNGKSSSATEEAIEDWENRVLVLLFVVTEDVDCWVECVRDVTTGGGAVKSPRPAARRRPTPWTPSFIPSRTWPGAAAGV